MSHHSTISPQAVAQPQAVGQPQNSASTAGQSEENLPLTVIRLRRSWLSLPWREIWQYRDLLMCLALRDIKVRYKQTALGVVWAVLQPLLMVLVFTVVLSRMAGVETSGVPYPVFALCGFLVWTLFSRAVTAAAGSVVGSQALITKVYFPRLILPLSAVASALVDFFVAAPVLLVMMVSYGVPVGRSVWLAPLIIAAAALFALGTGIWLSALSVTYRDFKHTLPLLIQIWMFATPAIYLDTTSTLQTPRSAEAAAPAAREAQPAAADGDQPARAGSRLAFWFQLNPLSALVESFRASVLGKPLPWGWLGWSCSAALLVLLGGCLAFRRAERSFADII